MGYLDSALARWEAWEAKEKDNPTLLTLKAVRTNELNEFDEVQRINPPRPNDWSTLSTQRWGPGLEDTEAESAF